MRLLIAPAFAAMLWVGAWASARGLPARFRAPAVTVATAAILTALNAINLCNPDWCGHYGFPVPYYSWSDSMLTVGDTCFGCAAYHPAGAVVDVACGAVVCLLVFRHGRLQNRDDRARGLVDRPIDRSTDRRSMD